MQKVRFTCQERLIFLQAPYFSPRCSWQHAWNNRRSTQSRPVLFPTWSRQKAYPRHPLRRSLIHKKRFEYSRRGNYFEDVTATTRCAVVVIAICSWIAISNHCAFAAVAAENKAETGCPFHSKPAKQKEQSSQVQCCKILRAVVFAKTKDWARNDAKFCDANFPVQTSTIVVCCARTVPPLLLDTGPPGTFSFAELILQRSLLAHAPPFVA